MAEPNRFLVHDNQTPLSPNMRRVMLTMTDQELLDEQKAGRGGPEFQAAIKQEIRLRKQKKKRRR